MSSEFQLPPTWQQAAPILERALQESSATLSQVAGARKRPLPPRNLVAQGGSLQILLTWNAPQRNDDVTGYRIYKDNESNLIHVVTDPNTRQFTVSVPANTSVGLYVSSVNSLGVESIKVAVIGKSNTDQYVVTGTTGGTGGSTPPRPPGYENEPTGGGTGGRHRL